jgi:chemotaxis protein histidine kinase CheA
MKPIFYAYMITVLVVSACSSGKSTFEHGNYYEAVLTSVNRLRRNSDHKKSVETLRQAYPMAVTFYEDRAKTSLASAEPFKWNSVVDSYTAINTMYDEIKRCPGALAVIPNPINYFSKLQEAKQNAAEEQYAAGILALQVDDRESAKKAYAFFKAANAFVPGYKEVNSYLQAALDAATVKIVVEPIPVHSKAVGVSAEFFNDKISEYVHSASISEFVKFYTRDEAKKIKLNPNHIIQLEFDDFTVGQVTTNEKEIHLTKDSVVMATYVTASDPNTSAEHRALPAGNNLITTTPPVASTVVSPSTSATLQSDNQAQSRTAQALAEREAAEKALAAQQLAEKQRAEKEAAERARVAQELAAKQQAEKETAEKLLAEKQKAERAAAEKALAAQQLAEKERAEKEAAAQALAAKEKAEKEAAEKALAAQQLADKEKADKDAAAKALAAQQLADKQRAEKEAAEKALAEKQQAEKEAAEKALAAQQLADKQRAEKEAAEKALEEKRKAEADAAKVAEAERQNAEKEKAEREKAEKEKAEKDKAASYIDDTIRKEDTTDVKDPVTICHVPPGNPTNRRTLVISRSALQAHLRHGDSEGSCNGDEKQKGKPQQGEKGQGLKNGQDNKGPADKKNEKTPGKNGSTKIERKTDDHVLLFNSAPMFIASSEAGSNYLRYLDTPSDTNKVYGTVKATLYQYKKTTVSRGVVSFRIVDAKTGALLASEKMPGEYVWVSEWATFNGDERALSAEQLRLSTLKEQPAPAPQDLFIEFTRPIYDQITVKIRDFYKNY